MGKKQGGVRLKITERALYQRINRRLKQDSRQLLTARSARAESSVGHHYILKVDQNLIVRQRVDIEALGRELDVLRPWEELET